LEGLESDGLPVSKTGSLTSTAGEAAAHDFAKFELHQHQSQELEPIALNMPATFFDLPRELLDLIYKEVLVSPTGIVQPWMRFEKNNVHLNYPSYEKFSLSLIRTCRQIHREVKDIFWDYNAFRIGTRYTDLQNVGEVFLHRVTSVIFDVDYSFYGRMAAFRERLICYLII